MKPIFFLLLFTIFLQATSFAQTNSYLRDLSALRSVLQKTPSFKAQIKGERLREYEELYARLAANIIDSDQSYEYFYHLSQLLFPLNDNHLGFYQIPNFQVFKSQESIDSLTSTAAFLNYPSISIDLDSLRTSLARQPEDSITGVYYYGNLYTVGLFRKTSKEYIGVVLESDTNLWRKGQLAIHLYEYTPGLFKAIYGHPVYKSFMLQANEKYRNQSLINSHFYGSHFQVVYSKKIKESDFINLPPDAGRFAIKNMEHNIQYLLIRSFQRNAATVQESRSFYDSLKNQLTSSPLILDLRNNEGGSELEARKYLKLLRSYAKKGHLYILLNNETLSQAEIFTLQLLQLKNVTTLGQTTKGSLTYGSNYGHREKLPSEQFEIYPTDMKGRSRLLQYENRGIDPHITLNEDSDWVGQTINIINKK